MNAWSTLPIAAALAALAAGCNPYDPRLDDVPFRCGMSEPSCPDGYVCVPEDGKPYSLCKSEDIAELPDAGTGGPDGGILECHGDNGLEPNENIGDPTNTPIPDFRDDVELVGMQICPMGDVDVYLFRIDQSGKNVKAELMYPSAAGTLQLDILNSVGTSIKTGTVVGGNNDLLSAEVPNLPIGNYFAQVRGTTGVRNRYDISITVTGP